MIEVIIVYLVLVVIGFTTLFYVAYSNETKKKNCSSPNLKSLSDGYRAEGVFIGALMGIGLSIIVLLGAAIVLIIIL